MKGIYGGARGAIQARPGWKNRAIGAGLGVVRGLTGMGDYRTVAAIPDGSSGIPVGNQLIEGMAQGPMRVNAAKNLTDDIYLKRTEFLGNITVDFVAPGTSTFQISKYPLNIGLSTVFPWGSQIAVNFELYDFRGLVFEFRPLSGEYGSTSSNSLGKVIMATNYDPNAPAYENSIDMSNSAYAMSCKPSVGMLHGVETANRQDTLNMFHVRHDAVVAGDNARWYDLGNLWVATEGITSSSAGQIPIGELWVTYNVKLSRPRLFSNTRGDRILCGHFMGRTITDGGIGITCSEGSADYRVANSNYTPLYAAPIGANYFCAKLTNNIDVTMSSSNMTTCTLEFGPSVPNGVYMFGFGQVFGGNYTGAITVVPFGACIVSGNAGSAAEFHGVTNSAGSIASNVLTYARVTFIKLNRVSPLSAGVSIFFANPMPTLTSGTVSFFSITQIPANSVN